MTDLTSLTADALVDDGVAALSLDVFDTLVTRVCGEPSDLYLWLGRLLARGGLPVSAEVFARARSRAEAVVWHREGGMDSDVGLHLIHEEVVRVLGLGTSVDQLVEAELALERRVSRPVPGADALLAMLGEAEHLEWVLASDTYLSGQQLGDLLGVHGWDVRDRLLVSSDRAAAKASGRLFAHVLEVLDRPPARVLHCGDNPHADIDVARALGLRAAWMPRARLTDDERALSEASFATAGLGAALAGASRLARTSTTVDDRRRAVIRDVAAGVAAPVLVGYVLWVLERAGHHGVDRVSFLARDGQVLSAIARRLVDRLDLDLVVDYLAVSRQSTNLAATFDVRRDETDWVFRDTEFLSTDELLGRFDLTWDEVRPHLRGAWSETPPTATDVAEEIRAGLEQPGVLRDLVLGRAAARRSLVTDYLAEHGLLGPGSTAIVDFGGVGSQVRAVHELVAAAGGEPPRILLVGLDDPAQAGLRVPDREPAWLRRTETWLYDHRRGRGIRRDRGFGTLVQMFCAADHGTVTGYRRGPDGVEPELAVARDEAVLAWGLDILQATITSVADNVLLDDDVLDVHADLRAVATRRVQRLWSDPTEAEAAAWGGFPFEGAQATSTDARPLAHRYTATHVLRGMNDGDFPNLGWQHWYEGSLRLSSRPLRLGLRVAEDAFRALQRAEGPISSRVVGWARARRR